jgi:hypothetical protein
MSSLMVAVTHFVGRPFCLPFILISPFGLWFQFLATFSDPLRRTAARRVRSQPMCRWSAFVLSG